MNEAALKRFDERTIQLKEGFREDLKRFDEGFREDRKRFDERTHQLKLEMKEIERELERKIEESGNKNVQRLTINIGIMLSLLTIIATVLHLSIR